MFRRIKKDTARVSWKLACVLVAVSFIASSVAMPRLTASYALNAGELPATNQMLSLTPAFSPPVLRGITVNPDDPLTIEFILDEGAQAMPEDQAKKEAELLTKYFLAGLTIPETDLWVNLSVFEKDMVVPDDLGSTEMGRDLLAQDYILKQMLASLMHPDSESGKVFWSKVYAKSNELYGATDIPIDTFNKIWIVPEKAVVYEQGTEAIVGESRLKVMLESDYLAMKKTMEQEQPNASASQQDKVERMNKEASVILKDTIIPIIEKEVNEGKNFASVRQIYHSMILAAWYKQKLVDSIINKAYSDKGKLSGINLSDPAVKQKIFQQYADAYKKGMYDLVKKEYDQKGKKDLPRRYFSGGITFTGFTGTIAKVPAAFAKPVAVNMQFVQPPAPVQFETLTPAIKASSAIGKNLRSFTAAVTLVSTLGALPAVAHVTPLPAVAMDNAAMAVAPVSPLASFSAMSPGVTFVAVLQTPGIQNAVAGVAGKPTPVNLPVGTVHFMPATEVPKLALDTTQYKVFAVKREAMSMNTPVMIAPPVQAPGKVSIQSAANAAPLSLNEFSSMLAEPVSFQKAVTPPDMPAATVEKVVLAKPAMPSGMDYSVGNLNAMGTALTGLGNVQKGLATSGASLGPIVTIQVDQIGTKLAATPGIDRTSYSISDLKTMAGTLEAGVNALPLEAPNRPAMLTQLSTVNTALSTLPAPEAPSVLPVGLVVSFEAPLQAKPDIVRMQVAPISPLGRPMSVVSTEITVPKLSSLSAAEQAPAILKVAATTIPNIEMPSVPKANMGNLQLVEISMPPGMKVNAPAISSFQTGSTAGMNLNPVKPIAVNEIQPVELTAALALPAAVVPKVQIPGGIDLNTAGMLETVGSSDKILFKNLDFDLSQFAGFAVEIEMGKPQVPAIAATPAAMPKP